MIKSQEKRVWSTKMADNGVNFEIWLLSYGDPGLFISVVMADFTLSHKQLVIFQMLCFALVLFCFLRCSNGESGNRMQPWSLLVLDREQPFQTKHRNNYIFNRGKMVYDLKLKAVSSLHYSFSFVALEKPKSSTIWATVMTNIPNTLSMQSLKNLFLEHLGGRMAWQ